MWGAGGFSSCQPDTWRHALPLTLARCIWMWKLVRNRLETPGEAAVPMNSRFTPLVPLCRQSGCGVGCFTSTHPKEAPFPHVQDLNLWAMVGVVIGGCEFQWGDPAKHLMGMNPHVHTACTSRNGFCGAMKPQHGGRVDVQEWVLEVRVRISTNICYCRYTLSPVNMEPGRPFSSKMDPPVRFQDSTLIGERVSGISRLHTSKTHQLRMPFKLSES